MRRHRSDNEINNQLTEIVNADSSTLKCKWRKLRPGDFVRLELNAVIPADIILLKSSDPQNICFVETANLDGETSLKTRHSATLTKVRTRFLQISKTTFEVLLVL